MIKYIFLIFLLFPTLASAGEIRLGLDAGFSTASYETYDYYGYYYTESDSSEAFDLKLTYSTDFGQWNSDFSAGYAYTGINIDRSSFVADIDAKYRFTENHMFGPDAKILINNGSNLLFGLKYAYAFDTETTPSNVRLEVSYFSDFDNPTLNIFLLGISTAIF